MIIKILLLSIETHNNMLNISKLNIYTGGKMYLVSHQLCKFSHLKRWERPVIKINPENHIVGFLKNLFANYGGK